MKAHGTSSARDAGRAPALEWVEVSLRLGAFALADVSLRVEAGAWVALVGPTGAGKTLLLETAVGFLSPAHGEIRRDGIAVSKQPPELRRLGYVPQDDLLFAHLDVRRNILFGARKRGLGPSALEGELLHACGELGITPLLERRVAGISGGEAQRVTLARALLSGADTLLLDECTSALDDDTGRAVGDVLARWRRERGLSIVQVTHDLEEAHRLADVVVGMEAGRLTRRIVPAPPPGAAIAALASRQDASRARRGRGAP